MPTVTRSRKSLGGEDQPALASARRELPPPEAIPTPQQTARKTSATSPAAKRDPRPPSVGGGASSLSAVAGPPLLPVQRRLVSRASRTTSRVTSLRSRSRSTSRDRMNSYSATISSSAGGGSVGECERDMKYALSDVRAKYGTSHSLVHDPATLKKLYQEHLDTFEGRVAAMIENGDTMNPQRLRKFLDVPEPKNGSFLILAVKQRKLDIVRLLTGNHDALSIKDRNQKPVNMVEANKSGQLGRTALFEACRWGDREAVKLILDYKQGWELPFDNEAGIGLQEVDLILGDRQGTTPLMIAVKHQHAEVVKLLTSSTALQHHPNVAMSLRCTGKDQSSLYVDAKDSDGFTALHLLCKHRIENMDILSELLKAQASVSDVCSKRKTPLHYACEYRHIQMAAYLIRNNANPNARDISGQTPMHHAVNHDTPPLAIVASLLASNAAIAPVDNAGDTPLHLLFRKKKQMIVQSSEGVDVSEVISAISETVDLLLSTVSKQDGSFEVRKVLAMQNKAGESAFTDEDKELHFQVHRKELKEIVDQSRESDTSVDNSLLEKVLTQQAVHQKWNLLCWNRKLKESLGFLAILFLFTVVAVARTGFGSERSDVCSGLKQTLKGRFGRGGRGAENGIELDQISSAPEAFLFFEGVAHEIGLSLGPFVGASFDSPLDLRSAGEIVGRPVVKQWRVGGAEGTKCAVSPKIRKAACLSDFSDAKRSVPASIAGADYLDPSTRADVESKLKAAFEPRSLYVGHRIASKYPSESYSFELPLGCLGRRENDSTTAGAPVCPPMDQSALLFRALHEANWVDSSTMALSFEVAFYTPHQDFLSIVSLISEFSAGSSRSKTKLDIRSLKINSWNFRVWPDSAVGKAWEVLLIIMEFLVCMLIPSALFSDLRVSTADWSFTPAYLRRLSMSFIIARSVDLLCVVFFARVLWFEFLLFRSVDSLEWGAFVTCHHLANLVEIQGFSIAMTSLMLWIKVFTAKLQAFRHIIILLSAITQMIAELFSFFGILFMVYVAFGSTKFLISGSEVEGGFIELVLREFWASIDVGRLTKEETDDDDAATMLVVLLGPLFAVFVLLILMNVLVTMLMDLYSNEKDAAEAHWCLEQAKMIFDEEDRLEAAKKLLKRSLAPIPLLEDEQLAADLVASPVKRDAKLLWKKGISSVIKQNNVLRALGVPGSQRVETINEMAMSLRNPQSDLFDLEKFEKCLGEVVPELLHIVGDVRTPDGIGEDIGKISTKIINTMHALRRVVAVDVKDHDAFLVPDSDNKALPPGDNTTKLQDYVMNKIGLNDVTILEGLIAALAYAELGKISLWREQLQEVIGDFDSVSDYRVLLRALLEDACHSRFLPSFRGLSRLSKTMIIKAFEADFNLGQFSQLECVPGSMLELQRIATESKEYDGRRALHFGLFMQLLGISGGPRFGGRMPSEKWADFFGNFQTLEKLADGLSPIQVYDGHVLGLAGKTNIAAQLEDIRPQLEVIYKNKEARSYFATFEAFVASLQKALLRLARMSRYDKPEQVGPLLAAALNLPHSELCSVVKELNRNGIDDGWAIVLMYSPMCLQNLINDTETSLNDRLLVGLRCIHRLYQIVRVSLELKLRIGETGGGRRERADSKGSNDSASSAGSDGSNAPEPTAGDDLAENGVYEVDCYQVATWAKKSSVLDTIIGKYKTSIFLEDSDSIFNYSKGEAAFHVNHLGLK